LLGFQRLLAVALDHDNREEAPDNGRTENDEDDGNTNGPDAWEEERVKEGRTILNNCWLKE
jgi:hypothetical protein